MHTDVDQAALAIAKLLPAVAVNLRVAALFDAAGVDLTANQLVTLLLVAQADGARLRAGDVARSLSISAASATALVDRLVEAGFLVRVRGDDRRVVWVCLTESSHDLIEKLEAGTVLRVSTILASTTPEDRDTLIQALRRVATFAHQITDGDTS